jgi:hypothetical protein
MQRDSISDRIHRIEDPRITGHRVRNRNDRQRTETLAAVLLPHAACRVAKLPHLRLRHVRAVRQSPLARSIPGIRKRRDGGFRASARRDRNRDRAAALLTKIGLDPDLRGRRRRRRRKNQQDRTHHCILLHFRTGWTLPTRSTTMTSSQHRLRFKGRFDCEFSLSESWERHV